MPQRKIFERVHVRGDAEGVNDENGARAGSDGPLDGGGVEIEGDGIDLRKDRRGAHLKHGVGHGDKGKGRQDDFVALADAQREQRQMQAGCAGTDGYSVLNAVIRGQLRLERRELRTPAKMRRAQDGSNGRDLGLGDVGRGEGNARGHERSGCAASARCGSGAGCLMSNRSSGTEASTRAMVCAAVPSP